MPFKSILVTGGAGFIGSNFVRMIANEKPKCAIVVLDALTYAGNLENIADLVDAGRVRFVKGDIRDPAAVRDAMAGAEVVFTSPPRPTSTGPSKEPRASSDRHSRHLQPAQARG
jgi:nucleoside-diphosphate-sugar epimerase